MRPFALGSVSSGVEHGRECVVTTGLAIEVCGRLIFLIDG
jgi:hypothetical protein